MSTDSTITSRANTALPPRRVGSLMVVAVVVVAITFLGANWAFLVGIVAVPLGLYLFLSAIVRLARARTGWPVAGITGACGVVILLAGATACSVHTSALESKLAPLVAALERYRVDNGNYPERLDSLVPTYLRMLPTCPGRPVSYSRPIGATPSFDLTCVTFGFNKHSYDSFTAKWKDWD